MRHMAELAEQNYEKRPKSRVCHGTESHVHRNFGVCHSGAKDCIFLASLHRAGGNTVCTLYGFGHSKCHGTRDNACTNTQALLIH